jgi:hypothetical protein
VSAKHTPGPWKVETLRPSIGDPYPRVVAANGECLFVGCGEESQYADAHLIAAAPMLLAAITRLMSGTTTMQDAAEAAAQARAAIAAATGEQP